LKELPKATTLFLDTKSTIREYISDANIKKGDPFIIHDPDMAEVVVVVPRKQPVKSGQWLLEDFSVNSFPAHEWQMPQPPNTYDIVTTWRRM